MAIEVTTVADDIVVLHDGPAVHRFEGLAANTEHDLLGQRVRTLPRPGGELLTRFATVNDVHFGEVECGRIDDHPMGPILRLPPGETPYPILMNRGAIAEMTQADLAAVIVKGDLTNDGTPEEFAAFEAHYRTAFGDRLHVVRGNHDSYRGQDAYTGDTVVALPGVLVALLDTARPRETTGHISVEQRDWLDELASRADRPVLVMGHHQNWVSGRGRDPGYFGIDPDSSEAMIDVFARRPAVRGYFAGHTHRHRVRTTLATGSVPYVEVGCVKDFPGTWAEYRVYEGGIMQIVHRISAPDALAWSERCRDLYRDFGIDYAAYALGTLAERCFVLPERAA